MTPAERAADLVAWLQAQSEITGYEPQRERLRAWTATVVELVAASAAAVSPDCEALAGAWIARQWGRTVRDAPQLTADLASLLRRALEDDRRARPLGCPGCCHDCLEATGGQCRAHMPPECTCYELHGAGGGHQPGCPLHGRPTP